ncbi:MAG: transglutaminase domain-containing protein [Actinomycetota bacterium]
MTPSAALDHAIHTAFSDPGRHRDRVEQLPTDVAGLSAVARNVIVHYRASGHELPTSSRDDINARWLEGILDIDADRHPSGLAEERAPTERVQGCCRDHTLFCVGALRQHGIPARSRVGFAGYFVDGWHHDHVIVEAWLDGRWHRFDPEVDAPTPALAAPEDMHWDELDGTGFVTAAQVWAAYRAGDLDPATYGVDPDIPLFAGPRFVFDEVIYEVAHRFGDELLLWDGWGRIGEPGSPVSAEDAEWLDPVAELLLAADGGDIEAEQRLLAHYRADDGLHPGPMIQQASPYGDPPIMVELPAR